MATPGQYKTIGATKTFNATNTVSSRDSYSCANAQITRGITSAPISLSECYERFPNISFIGNVLGVDPATAFSGPSVPSPPIPNILSTLTGQDSVECEKIQATLGESWLGCLWGSPESPFSCTCPNVGDNFINYLKFRLNVATFWNTPKATPPKRREFLDSVKYGSKISITIAGDTSIRPGDIITIKADNISGYPINQIPSMISKKYYVVSTKNTYLNTGAHETSLVVTDIFPKQTTSQDEYEGGPATSHAT